MSDVTSDFGKIYSVDNSSISSMLLFIIHVCTCTHDLENKACVLQNFTNVTVQFK